MHLDPRCLADGRFDLAAAEPITRAGYRDDYDTIGPLCATVRPTA